MFLHAPTHPPTHQRFLTPADSLGPFTSQRKMKPMPKVLFRSSIPFPKPEEKGVKRSSEHLTINVIPEEGKGALPSQTKLQPFTRPQALMLKLQLIQYHGACCPLVASTLTCKRKRHLLPNQWREGKIEGKLALGSLRKQHTLPHISPTEGILRDSRI